jgi:hypothetical protein
VTEIEITDKARLHGESQKFPSPYQIPPACRVRTKMAITFSFSAALRNIRQAGATSFPMVRGRF